MGLWRDIGRAWSEDRSLANARALNRIDDYNKHGRGKRSGKGLLDNMGVPYGRFDLVKEADDDDE